MTSTGMFSAADAVPYSNMRTVIIRWKEYQMTEATDKSVLMICEKCGYKENVPWSDLLRIDMFLLESWTTVSMCLETPL